MSKLRSWKSIIFLSTLLILPSCQTIGNSCTSDSECPSLYLCEHSFCTHQGLLPISIREIFSTIFIALLCSFAVSGGVGAGAVFVPFFEILFNFQLNQAIVRAYTIMLGAGIGNLVYILRLRHQENKRSVINYNINLFIIPGLMIGVAIGSMVQKIIAPLISNILLVIIMAYSAQKYIRKAVSIIRARRIQKKKEQETNKIKQILEIKEKSSTDNNDVSPIKSKESQQMANLNEIKEKVELEINLESPIKSSDTQNVLNLDEIKVNSSKQVDDQSKENKSNPEQSYEEDPNEFEDAPQELPQNPIPHQSNDKTKTHTQPLEDPRVTKMRKRDLALFPSIKYLAFFTMIIIIFVFGILRGGKAKPSIIGIPYCGTVYWILFALSLVAFFLCIIGGWMLVKREQQDRQALQVEFTPCNPYLNKKDCFLLILISFLAGVIGNIAALGGGLLINPYLYDMKLPPSTIAFSSGFFLNFTLLNSLLLAYLGGQIGFGEIGWFVAFGFVFASIVSRVMHHIIKKTQNHAINPAITSILCIVGGCLIVWLFISDSITNWHKQMTFHGVCDQQAKRIRVEKINLTNMRFFLHVLSEFIYNNLNWDKFVF